jgi:hypothetical protein
LRQVYKNTYVVWFLILKRTLTWFHFYFYFLKWKLVRTSGLILKMIFLVCTNPSFQRFSITRSLHGIGTSDEDCAHLDRKESYNK